MIALEQFRTPGQYIQFLLDERAWTQKVLAIVLGIDETGLNKIITGKRPLDAELALSLSLIFSVPAENFLTLQTSYDLAMARLVTRPDPSLKSRAELFGGLPISDMVKRGWLEGVTSVRDVSAIEDKVQKFLRTHTLDTFCNVSHAAKKTNQNLSTTPVQAAWLIRVQQMAEEMLVEQFSLSTVKNVIGQLSLLRNNVENLRKIPRLLEEAGIRFVIVEGLPGAKIDGACLWLRDDAPVVALSLRFDRVDNFWFVLRHELEHVIRGDGKSAPIMDVELEQELQADIDQQPPEERIANRAAADFCVDQQALLRFIAKKSPYFADRDIIGFARTLGVHPGLVAGQLQRTTKRFDKFRQHLTKVRTFITPCANVDGWGETALVGEMKG